MSTGLTEGQLPTWRQLARAACLAAQEDGEWAGAPMPVHGIPLRVEPRYPYAGLDGFCFGDTGPEPPGPADDGPEVKFVNEFFCSRRMTNVVVFEVEGRRRHFLKPQYGGKKLGYWVRTIGAARAWDGEAEWAACETLSGVVSEWAFRCYMLTGSFLETSKRSGVQYLFRKLRPTVAMRGTPGGDTRVLTTLCLHPIGYYDGTWAGAMVPTDDVIAHLLLMRGDEPKFWAKANHHPAWSAAAGL